MTDLHWFEVNIENIISFEGGRVYIFDIYDVSVNSVYDEDGFWTMEHSPSET